MSNVWNKLFGNAPVAANDEPRAVISGVAEAPGAYRTELPREAQGALASAARALPRADLPSAIDDSYDAIGQRNETLRNQLDGIAESFRNIETIRTQFEHVVSPIARLLRDLEETKSALEDSRQRHAGVSIAHDDLQRIHGAVLTERDALAEQRDALQGDNRQAHLSLRETEAALGDWQLAANAAGLKVGNLERSLETAQQNIKGLEEAGAALRTTLDGRERALTEAEQRRAAVSHQFEMAQEEARALRKQLEDQSHETSKVARLHADVDAQRNDLSRRVSELENQLGQEVSQHAKVKSQRQDESETSRVQLSALSGELSAARARAETAERLLTDARAELRDKQQEARAMERRILDAEAGTQSQAKKQAELARELAAARARNAELEASRTVLIERASGLSKGAKAKDSALQRAEEKISLLEARLSEAAKGHQTSRAQLEARVAQLGEQAQTESAARAYAEGALQSARRDRLNMQREIVGLKSARGEPTEGAASAADSPVMAVEAPAEEEAVVMRIAG